MLVRVTRSIVALLAGLLCVPLSASAQTVEVIVDPPALTCRGGFVMHASNLAGDSDYGLYGIVPRGHGGAFELGRARSTADGRVLFTVAAPMPVGTDCDEPEMLLRINHLTPRGSPESWVTDVIAVPIVRTAGVVRPPATGNLGATNVSDEATPRIVALLMVTLLVAIGARRRIVHDKQR